MRLDRKYIRVGSEEFFIPYVSPVDRRVHRYFPDFIIKVKESTGQVKTYVIEVNQNKQRNLQVSHHYLSAELMQSIKRSGSHREWCADRRIEFKIITEDELGIKYGR